MMKDRLAERFRILSMVDRHRISLCEAAVLLRLSHRQIRRLYKRYHENGVQGLVHGLKGRTSNRKIPDGVRQSIISYYKNYYRNSGPTFFAGKLACLGYAVSRETLRRWLIQEGLCTGKRNRGTVFTDNKRKLDFGEVIWLYVDEYRGPGEEAVRSLIVNLLDQATGMRLSLLAEQEPRETALRLLRMWVEEYGIPMSIGCEKQFVYKDRPALPVAPDIDLFMLKTGFVRVCGILGIEVIMVPDYEIKKRLHPDAEIYYHYITKELRAAKPSDPEQANRFLCNGFISKYNSRFSRPQTALHDAHVKLRPENDVDGIFGLVRE
jgi:hypothetical protein